MSIQPRTRSGALATLLLTLMLPHGDARAEEPKPQVKVTTNVGEFVIEVRQDRSPLTAANFLRYVREGFYSGTDRKSTRLNSSHLVISYAVFCLKKKKNHN